MRVSGQANDTPAVLMEIRAADLASRIRASGPRVDRRPNDMTDDEFDGYLRGAYNSPPINNPEHQHMCTHPMGWVRSRLAGWLAYQIVHHKEP